MFEQKKDDETVDDLGKIDNKKLDTGDSWAVNRKDENDSWIVHRKKQDEEEQKAREAEIEAEIEADREDAKHLKPKWVRDEELAEENRKFEKLNRDLIKAAKAKEEEE